MKPNHTACAQLRRLVIATASLLLGASGVGAEVWWIPVVAHAPGVAGSAWRSDLTVLSLCDGASDVELRFHGPEAAGTLTKTIDGRSQELLVDVVGQLVAGDAIGALEVVAEGPVAVSSSTYDTASAAAGAFGQTLEAVSPAEGAAAGGELYLPALVESGAARSNIGILNMGSEAAEVEVILADRFGREVGRFPLTVAAGRSLQDNRPFRLRFGHSDVDVGSARIQVRSGTSIWAWGSVIDEGTGDPRTVLARALEATCPEPSIAAELWEIDGLTVSEQSTDLPGYRYFELRLTQPADHANPASRTFLQSVTLLHRSFDVPVVLETLGYGGGWQDSRAELTEMLGANQIVVEHRFFGSSRPRPTDWSLLTIEQSSADLHRVVEVFRKLYHGPWISTGHSKGGMTAAYHRRFYPDDVVATVPYVAPISYGAPDPRYVPFFDGVGPEPCRQQVEAIQRQVLLRRTAMLGLLTQQSGLEFTRIGGPEAALEAIALEVPWTFWQYSGVAACGDVPAVSASDRDIFDFVDRHVGFYSAADFFFDFFEPYYFQAATQLGYPAVPKSNIEDLLETHGADLEAGLLPEGVTASYDPAPMPDVAAWLADHGRRFLFVYGQWDPWSAGAFDLGNAVDSHLFVEPMGTHGALISTLAAADRERAFDVLERWTGRRPVAAAPVSEAARRNPPWRRRPPPREE